MQNQMLTINETSKRSAEDGMRIAASRIRQWVKTGVLPHVMCGGVALIYYPNFCAYVTGGAIITTTDQDKEGERHE